MCHGDIFNFLILIFLLLVNQRDIQATPTNKFFDFRAPEYETFLSPTDFAAIAEDATTSKDADYRRDAMYSADLFEGDIMNELNASTVALFVNGAPPTSSLKDDVQLNAIRDRRQLWKNGRIPYAISNQYTPHSRAIIASAMNDYAHQTCIQWTPRTHYDNDYIYIVPERGCYSMVGRTGNRQTLSLGAGCIQRGVILHEMMHAVGFFHEQSRADRDNAVIINWQNIQPGMQNQFDKYTAATIQSLGTSYDYNSIMHYDQAAFSRNGQPTIVPRVNARIGQRAGFSPMDVYKINRLYECSPPAAVGVTAAPPPPSPSVPQPLINVAKRAGNQRPDCEQLAAQGWCTKNGDFMRSTCPETARRVCERAGSTETCEDLRVDCVDLVKKRYCITNRRFAADFCPLSCGFCHSPAPVEPSSATSRPVAPAPPVSATVAAPVCRDRSFRCVEWRKAGYCRGRHAGYMRETCPRSCQYCRN